MLYLLFSLIHFSNSLTLFFIYIIDLIQQQVLLVESIHNKKMNNTKYKKEIENGLENALNIKRKLSKEKRQERKKS